jgi:hypothetical protein
MSTSTAVQHSCQLPLVDHGNTTKDLTPSPPDPLRPLRPNNVVVFFFQRHRCSPWLPLHGHSTSPRPQPSRPTPTMRSFLPSIRNLRAQPSDQLLQCAPFSPPSGTSALRVVALSCLVCVIVCEASLIFLLCKCASK